MSDLNGVICPTLDEKGSQSPSFNCYDIPLVCKWSCEGNTSLVSANMLLILAGSVHVFFLFVEFYKP